MTLAETSESFLADIRKNESVSSQSRSPTHEKALSLLTGYFSPGTTVSEISPMSLRDFLARWYVEKACTSNKPDRNVPQMNSPSDAAEMIGDSQESKAQALGTGVVPNPTELLASLSWFFKWMDQQEGSNFAERIAPLLLELSRSLPRALEITDVLSGRLRERGGAFGFPEFLTSFEEGGHSEYDIDTPGSVGALEGYFRILRVEGSSVEAEELISEERVWPIVFPPEVASLMDDQYIINLELVRSPAGWQIAGCGFAYPPGTDV